MLFKFLSYLQPTHYFSLCNHNGDSVFPDAKALPIAVREALEVRPYYRSTTARDYDLSWQALHKGYIGHAATYTHFDPVPLIDEYHFVRTYFNTAWVWYVLLLRLLGLKNPIKELQAFFGSNGITRSTYLNTPIAHSSWNGFDSSLIKSEPKVSVIIPTLNRYEYLKDVLHDLEQQDYTNFEVLVVDQSEPYDASFYEAFSLELQVIRQEEKALWLARNTALKRSKGEYLLFFDDDSRVEPDWIGQHLKCLDYFKADLSSGVSISKLGDDVPAHYAFFRVSDQLDTGNVMIHKEVFITLGLFDRQFEKQRMGDGEFGLRAYLHGYLNVSNPYAKRLHLKVDQGGLRQMGSWDAFRTSKLLAPRPIPSVLYFYRRYFGNKQARYALMRNIPISIMPYRFKKNKALRLLGALVSILLLPLIVFQVYKSWRLSSNKLNQGPLIEQFDG